MQLVGEGRSAQIFAWDEGRVVKLYYQGVDRPSVEREFQATQLAFAAGVPVPHPFALIEHEGRHGIIFERINGSSGVALFRRQPWRLPGMMRRIAQLQAETLKAHVSGLPEVRGELAGTIRRGMQRGLIAEGGHTIIEQLDRLPADDRLCHMDFHPDNVMQTDTGWMIIDWMNARSGAVLADIARSCVIYMVSGPPPGASRGALISIGSRLANIYYRREIRRLVAFTSPELDAWILPVATARLIENIPGEREKLIKIIDRLSAGLKI